MGLFRAVGSSFKDGWNKNKREREAQENGETYSISSLPTMHFGFAEDMYKDDETNKTKSMHSISRIYNENLNYVSTTKQKTNKDQEDKHELLMVSRYGQTGNWADRETKTTRFENNFKLPIDTILSVSKNYKLIYEHAAEILTDYGIEESQANKNDQNQEVTAEYLELPVVPSMFNPFYGINVIGITGNTPLLNSVDEQSISTKGNNGQVYAHYNKKITEDLSDCSIKKLVELSNEDKLGRGIYKYADFMYCKNLGKYANNRLITLRKFPIPVGDDIWDIYGGTKNWGRVDLPPDIGRMVTWLDDTNKLDNILKYNYKEGWEKREGEMQDAGSNQESSEGTGLIGSIVNLANPTYRQMVGTGFAGSGNQILGLFEGNSGKGLFKTTSANENHSILGMYDKNKIYEPPGTVRDTHLYNGKLEFSQNIELVFDYELRAYENINPRTAFLDLLNNIHQVTYRTGKFWGGQVWFAGAPGNTEGWKTANGLINGVFDKVGDTIKGILTGDQNIPDLLGAGANKAAEALNKTANVIAATFKGENNDKILEGIDKWNIGGMLKGMIMNNLGRPALYATNSILTGDPVGLWHLTIGNPRNPIMSIGNLIIEEGTDIQHYGPLGIDDFPTGLKVTVHLKHAKSRDMIDIGKMYTMGRMGLGVPLSRTAIDDLYKTKSWTDLSETMFSTAFASTSPAISDMISQKSTR